MKDNIPAWQIPQHSDRYYMRCFINCFMMILCYLTLILILSILCWLLISFLMKGVMHFHWSVFIHDTPGPLFDKGGLRNAIVGSLLMTGGGLFLAIPIGIFTGTYLSEYGQNSIFSILVHFVNDVLLSAPSIVVGLFVYTIFVESSHHFSGWYGSIALAIIAIPIIACASDSVMRLVPQDMREAAMALGAPRFKVIIFIVYRAAGAGMLTGIILATARIFGETAPLLFTALGNNFLNLNMDRPMASLSLVIYNFAMSPYTNWQNLAWIGATLMTFFILFMNIIARIFLHYMKRYV